MGHILFSKYKLNRQRVFLNITFFNHHNAVSKKQGVSVSVLSIIRHHR